MPARSKSPFTSQKSSNPSFRTFTPGRAMLSSVHHSRPTADFIPMVKSDLRLRPQSRLRFACSRAEKLPAIKASVSTKADSTYSSLERSKSPENLRYKTAAVRESIWLPSRKNSQLAINPHVDSEQRAHEYFVEIGPALIYREKEVPRYRPSRSPIPCRINLSEADYELPKPQRCESPVSKREMQSIFDLDQVTAKDS